jgi:cysteine desulfurase/selenocysteine lyase
MRINFLNKKNDFPIFHKKSQDQDLCYLDSASTSQKPQQVLDALMFFYATKNANIHRGTYTLAEEATQAYENVRKQIAQFMSAHDAEIIFTSGTTEGINAVAATWGTKHINAGDEIVTTELEHHSNLLPWQRLADQKKAILAIIPVLSNGMLDMQKAAELITKKTKLVAVSQVANALGTHVAIKTLIKYAHQVGARVLVDAAQSVPHQKINIHELDCDFLAFSGHKMLAPTGVGILFVKKELHDQMPPYQLGGGMVFEVGLHTAKWLKAPHKFEAGTPPIAQVIGLGTAIEYFQQIDLLKLQQYEAALCAQLIDELLKIKKIRIYGPIEQLRQQGHMVSFTIDGMHGHDVAAYLDQFGICVRAGHHCAQPLMMKIGVDALVRASFYGVYNSEEDVAKLIHALKKLEREI